MNIEDLRTICLSFPGVTEDIKWENHLTFLVAGKMFCLVGLDTSFSVAIKVPTEDFDELIARPGIKQAGHFARRQWIGIDEENRISRDEWIQLLKQSYDLVVAKLSQKVQKEIKSQM
jgi:predicted DNA-binding protein (MmcQ/YjbR family)